MKGQSAEKLENDFREGLYKFLRAFHAEIEIVDLWEGYPECGDDIALSVAIKAPGQDYVHFYLRNRDI
jgi:hypothetical protein